MNMMIYTLHSEAQKRERLSSGDQGEVKMNKKPGEYVAYMLRILPVRIRQKCSGESIWKMLKLENA